MITLPLRTERLEIRAFERGDLEAMHTAWSDPEVMQWLPSGPAKSLAASRERLERHIERRRQDGWGLGAMVERANGDVLGACGLFPIESEPASRWPTRRAGAGDEPSLSEDGPETEVAYHLARRAWGRGFATEAAHAVLAAAFRELELERVIALAFPANQASIRVMEKLGMTYEQTASRYGIECVRYGVDSETWRRVEAEALAS